MLTETVFRSEDVPRAERFGAWQDCMRATMAPMEVTSEHAADFAARQRLLQFGPLSVWPVSIHPSRYRRTARHVRASDPEQYHLTLILPGSASLEVTQAGNRATSRPLDLYVLDTSQPCEVVSAPDGPNITGIGVEIPKAMVPLPGRRRIDTLLGRPMTARQGFGALLAQFLTRTSAEAGVYRAADVPRLNTVLIDLVTGLLGHELDAAAEPPDGTRQHGLVLRVRDHIERHARDPELSPATVAAAHHLSTRQLHRLFQDEPDTVASLIRARRLEGARRELTDPSLSALPVQAVACRWGFTSAAHFSRVFRAAHGMPPGDYRRLAADHRPLGTQGQLPGAGRQRHGTSGPAGSELSQPAA